MSDTRIGSARDHDRSDPIEGIENDPDAVAGIADGASGIADPDGQDDSDAGVAEPSNRARGGDAPGLSED